MFEKTISSSFHEVAELEKCNFEFDYYLLSPVFTSISKPGYKGICFEVNNIDKRIIGMGGVTLENLSKLTNLGFRGAGVLGGVWNSPSPITNFKKMMNYFTNNRSYR